MSGAAGQWIAAGDDPPRVPAGFGTPATGTPAPGAGTLLPWSLKLGSVAGVDVYIHATFVVLLAWLAAARWAQTRQVAEAISTIGLLIALFSCVLLHELGHALVARRFGYRTREITLLPIGGIARMERVPDTPHQNLVVALAGPAVNLAIAAILFAFMQVSAAGLAARADAAATPLLDQLFALNVMLAAFNLLPAFPMDGGRALQAVLTARVGHLHATRIAAKLGQMMALVFAGLGALVNPILLLIALFVWVGARQEAMTTEIRAALAGLTAGELAVTSYRSVQPDDCLEDVVGLMVHGSEPLYAVIERGELVGVLMRKDLLRGVRAGSGSTTVRAILPEPGPLLVERDTAADQLLARLQTAADQVAVVVDRNRLVGFVTTDAIATILALHEVAGDRALGWLRRRAPTRTSRAS